MICECCHAEYAVVDGLCAVCHAEETFDERDTDVVESDRARYVGTGARLDTKHTSEESERV